MAFVVSRVVPEIACHRIAIKAVGKTICKDGSFNALLRFMKKIFLKYFNGPNIEQNMGFYYWQIAYKFKCGLFCNISY